MFDGVIRILKNVIYIPDLKRNLVTLGELDDNGLSYKVENGVIKVIKGSMVVIKGIKKCGLYEVVGELQRMNQ